MDGEMAIVNAKQHGFQTFHDIVAEITLCKT